MNRQTKGWGKRTHSQMIFRFEWPEFRGLRRFPVEILQRFDWRKVRCFERPKCFRFFNGLSLSSRVRILIGWINNLNFISSGQGEETIIIRLDRINYVLIN